MSFVLLNSKYMYTSRISIIIVFHIVTVYIQSFVNAQTTNRVVFPKYGTPLGWSRYIPANLTSGVVFGFGGYNIPFPFRSYVRHWSGLRYVHGGLEPGIYQVSVGLIELTSVACKSQLRQFVLSVNGIVHPSSPVDIYQLAGCRKPLYLNFSRVPVSDGTLVLSLDHASPKSKFSPVLSNFIVTSTGTPVSSTSPRSSPSPSPPLLSNPPSVISPKPTTQGTPLPKWLVAFPKYGTPPGWTRYSPTDLTPGASVTFGGKGLPFPFRSIVRHWNALRYVQHGLVPAEYTVSIGLVEMTTLACQPNARTFNVNVNGLLHPSSPVDIYRLVGCRQPLYLNFSKVPVIDGTLVISLERAVPRSKYPPVLSNFIAVLDNPGAPTGPPTSSSPPISAPPTPTSTSVPTATSPITPATSPTPSPITKGGGGTLVRAFIDCGRSGEQAPQPLQGTSVRNLRISTNVGRTILGSSNVFRFAVMGTSFQYQFDLRPGAYTLTLGFVEISDQHCTLENARIFNVYINDVLELPAYNILANVPCFKAVEASVKFSVSSVLTSQTVVRFEGVSSDALVSFVDIRPQPGGCKPASGTLNNDDHGAHAIPGSYPPQLDKSSPKSYVDKRGLGGYNVAINGGKSHTHFFDTDKNEPGSLVEYTWTLAETGQVISRTPKFTRFFPLGVTRLKLTVVDSSCDRDESETTVTVTGTLREEETYCYFYRNGTVFPPVPAVITEGYDAPQFASALTGVVFNLPPFPFDKELFSMRCTFLLSVPEATVSLVRLSTFGSGHARLYKGTELIIDSTSSSEATTELPVGILEFDVLFRRSTLSIPPRIKFLIDGVTPPASRISHDQGAVVPIISRLEPDEGRVSGGTTVAVHGYGLYPPIRVNFGGVPGKVLRDGATSSVVFAVSPKTTSSLVVPVIARSAGARLKSNPANFKYGSECDSIAFKDFGIRGPNGSSTDFLLSPTTVQVWQDGRYYVGTFQGSVRVLTLDKTSKTISNYCYSEPLRDPRYVTESGSFSPRSILGLTFDPREKEGRPYVSVSTLYSAKKNLIELSNTGKYTNGAVERLKPGTDENDKRVCLVYDKRIVDGLPVSNKDHAVNGLVFTQDGDLLIAVGGNTNAGLPGWKLGSWWETPLSGAIVIARLSKPSFDGNITYANTDRHYALVQTGGDVSVYATGTRNPFALDMGADGSVYTVDQGPNCYNGNVAKSCSDFNEIGAAAWDYEAANDWPGKIQAPAGRCGFSVRRNDKLLHITEGSFYGHANLARGGDECAWVDPFTDQTAEKKDPPTRYKSPMLLVQSSVTGLGMYRGTHFCQSLTGQLILSTFQGSPAFTYRVGVRGSSVTQEIVRISKNAGIAFTENAHGDLLFLHYKQDNNVPRIVLKTPVISRKSGFFVSGYSPLRHGKQGGSRLTIGGNDLNRDSSVEVGGNPCPIVKRSWTELICVVPQSSVGGSRDIIVRKKDIVVTLPNAVLYTNV